MRPRIAIAGIATESSTFTRDVSPRERFSVERGEAIYAMYDWPRRFADLPPTSNSWPRGGAAPRRPGQRLGAVGAPLFRLHRRPGMGGLRDAGRLSWTRVERPLYPFDRDFEADLTPVLLPR